MRFLVVDDEEDVRLLLRMFLRSVGQTEIQEAASTIEARTALESGPADVMLLDISLPGEDGPSLLRSLRAEDREPRHVYMLSAVTRQARDEVSADLGVPVIGKPFTMDTLRTALADVLTG